MLNRVSITIPAEARDFPEWHHGRETYAVWVLRCDENQAIQEKFKAAREHLDGYLLEPYRRQPHITLFVCGFLVEEPKYNDDFTSAQLKAQIQTLKKTDVQPFEIEIGGLTSFASAPYLEVHDLDGGIARLREVLSNGVREFRTAPYTPHLTVGLYRSTIPSGEVIEKLAEYKTNPVTWKVERITFATYQAKEIAGTLTGKHGIVLGSAGY